MSKHMIEDPKWLAYKNRVAAERRTKAIERKRQAALRATTPGVATPASVMNHIAQSRMNRVLGGA